MPSTLLHGLFPATCAASEAPKAARLRRFLVALFIANFPDLDIALAVCLPAHFNDIHRNVGHNLFIFPLWVALGAYALKRWGGMATKQRWLASFLLVASHLVLDAMSVREAINGSRSTVPLLWPLSNEAWDLPVRIFTGLPPQLRYQNPLIDRVLSYQFWTATVFQEIFWAVVFSATYLAVRHLSRLNKKKRAEISPGPSQMAS